MFSIFYDDDDDDDEDDDDDDDDDDDSLCQMDQKLTTVTGHPL